MAVEAPVRSRRPAARQRGAHQLPAGRHGLTPEFVSANQRDRIVNATMIVAGVAGFPAMSVEDIISTAGVSRRTFYDHFRSKDDAFTAAHAVVEERIREALDAGNVPAAQAIGGLIDLFVDAPDHADVTLIEVLAAGERGRGCYERTVELVSDAIRLDPTRDKRRRLSDVRLRIMVGGLLEVIRSRAIAGTLDDLAASKKALVAGLAV